jgi:hypothetical protein
MHKGILTCGLALAVAAFATGCGSSSSNDPFGPEPDYAEVQGRFDHPTGTFNAANAGSVIGSANGSSDANVGGVFSGGSAATPGAAATQSLQILSGSAQFVCSDLQAGNRSGSCACPSGGSFTYEMDGGGDPNNSDITMKVRAQACASGDATVDGTEFVHVSSTKNASGQTDFRMLFVIHVTVRKGAQTHTLDAAEQYASGTLQIAVKVDDGWVTVVIQTAPSSITYEVRDKDGTWTCKDQNGAGTCTSSKGGPPVSFSQ